jgi:RNA polymerase sigma factor (sigma-70 family)
MRKGAARSPANSNPMTDEELIRLIAHQDATAFREFYDRYSGPLFAYLCRLLGDAHGAEDVLSEAMIAVWREARHFRGECRPRTWLYRIARNRAVEVLRHHEVRKKREVSLDGEFQEASVHPHAAVVDRVALEGALEALPPHQREAVELAFLHGLDYREIARITGVPVNTVKTRVYWAKRKLRRLVGEVKTEEAASDGSR